MKNTLVRSIFVIAFSILLYALTPGKAHAAYGIEVRPYRFTSMTDWKTFPNAGNAQMRTSAIKINPDTQIGINLDTVTYGSDIADTEPLTLKWSTGTDPKKSVPVTSVKHVGPVIIFKGTEVPTQIYVWAYRKDRIVDVRTITFLKILNLDGETRLSILETGIDYSYKDDF